MDHCMETSTTRNDEKCLCYYFKHCVTKSTPCVIHSQLSQDVTVYLSIIRTFAQSLCIIDSVANVLQSIYKGVLHYLRNGINIIQYIHKSYCVEAESRVNDKYLLIKSPVQADSYFPKSTPTIKSFQNFSVSCKGFTVTTRTLDLAIHDPGYFSIQCIADSSFAPVLDGWSIQASSVIWVTSKDTQFGGSAIVSVPLYVQIEHDCTVEVYVSYTGLCEATNWEQLNVSDIAIIGSVVQFTVTRLAMFTVVLSKKRPRACNLVHSNSGGSVVLKLDSASDIKITFPEEALFSPSIDVNVECLYYDQFYISNDLLKFHTLAAPIVALGPTGSHFQKRVFITLPLPKAKEVLCWNKNCSLKIMYSQTEVNKVPDWKILDTDYKINFQNNTVTFTTSHFTLFSVFWDILDSALPEHLKLHATFNLPRFSFWVYFRALMTEYTNKKQFGICVVCYRFNDPSGHFSNQYPHEIGTCKPRKIRAGKLRIQLKSGLFNADELAGESSLVKFVDFCGHDFDIHFACVFKSKEMLDVGLIGKVLVNNGQEELSFNLIKNSDCILKRTKSENILKQKKINRDLMSMCRVQKKWSDMAVALSCTKTDVKKKLCQSKEMLPQLLVNQHFENSTTAGCSDFDEVLKNSGSEIKSRFGKKDSRKRKFESIISSEKFNESKLDDIAGEVSKWWKSLGRKLDISEHKLQEIDLNFRHCGEKEKAFQMLLTWREKDPENCIPKNLFKILNNSGLNYTASQCLK